MPAADEDQPACHDPGRPEPAQNSGTDRGADNEAGRRRQGPETRHEGRKPEHQLQVLGHEEEVADCHKDAQEVRHE